MMHRRNMAWLALAFVLPLLLMLSARPAAAQGPVSGTPTVTDTDPAPFYITQVDSRPQPNGQTLWDGSALTFGPDTDPTPPTPIHRWAVGIMQADRPECDDGTVAVTASVHWLLNGPNPGVGGNGFLALQFVDTPTDLPYIDQHDTQQSAPVGYEETLTVSGTVSADDLATGNLALIVDPETWHVGEKSWTLDQFEASYTYGTAGCEPQIAIDKTGSGPDPLQVGDTVDYSFVVTNTGDLTLTNVTVTDPLDGMSPIACPSDTLAPGAEMTCTSTYTVTQEDADTGFIENTATVTGDPPDGPPVSDEDFAVVPPSQKPGISIEKSGSGPDPLEVGATIDYTFLVTNTGNVTLSDVTVTDPLPGLSPISCPDSTLAPGAEMTCTATYTVTQEDVDAGSVENTATVTGTPPGSLPPPTDESTTTVPPTQTSGIAIEKSGSGPDPLVVGATIDYTFIVTNTGNITLNNVTVTDPLPGLSPISCPGDTLAPGAEMTCTATYTVTQQDVDAGVVENTATVTGEPPTGGPPPTDESTTTVPPTGSPGIAMEKSGSGPDPLTVGATIDYTFVVTNTGNVTLTNVTVTDPLPGLSPINCPSSTLVPGAEMTCAALYEVTQADVEAGVVENTATVTGETPTGGPPPTDESTTTVPPIPPVPSLPLLAVVLLVALLATSALWTLRRARA